ncbi:sigma factor [Chromobacterium vaccinii]|uniref:sigma factor n=1 Tax=Chromobacterium vaccinii TaxID=1108595 RepID=UPI000E19600F|nr:sigma factor [Chromobacterium vaccinii]SUX54021.1 RNA polymerase sigma factor [Chromobacterium vaccinii]
MVDPQAIEQERPYLLRYALAQLRERDAAEEAVQETLLAALESRDNFRASRPCAPGSPPFCVSN